jgi:hypothetical protein
LPAFWTRELLQYGAFPWYEWFFQQGLAPRFGSTHSRKHDQSIVTADRVFFTRYGVTLPEIRQHWRRWHARLCKRQWLMLVL